MNVKELILSRPAAGIAAALVDRLDFEPAKRNEGIRRITALIDSLRGMEPEATNYILLGVYHMYDDREFLDANLYRKSELPAELAPLPDILEMKGIDELTADETEQAAAKDFVEFLTSDEAAAIFRNYYFDTEVE